MDSPKDYADKVYMLMNMAMGFGGEAAEGSSSKAAEGSSSSGGATAVEAEVVDPNDPWKK